MIPPLTILNQTSKKKAFILLLLILIIVSCKKEKPSVQIQVIDKITNTPVSGANLVVYKCGIFNCLLGTISLFTGSTNENGVCKVPTDSYNEAVSVNVTKSNYWPFDGPKGTSISAIPEGWIRLHILKTANYPSQAKLNITTISSTSSPSASAYAVSYSFNIAADSSVLIRAFGGQSNRMEWHVWDASSPSLNSGNWQQQVPRLDTVKNITLNY
jgi:hypothetical protein